MGVHRQLLELIAVHVVIFAGLFGITWLVLDKLDEHGWFD